jgi:hypothetical protein
MSLLSRRSKSTNKAARRRRPSLRSDFELLEDRRLLAPLDFLVTNNTDGGPGSLRQAIIDANATPGTNSVQFNIAVGAIAQATVPTAGSQPEGIAAGPDGNVWFTEGFASQIGRITPTGTITEFAIPTLGSGPFGITAGPDGNVWFTELDANNIGRATVSSAGLTISPTSALPTITDPVVIDATSQPGYAGSPLVEIDGSGAGAADGLTIQASGCTVAGLVINRFTADGILLENSGSNLIEGDFIGTDVTGTLGLGNSGSGIDLFNSPGNTIGGTTAGTRNVISGNKSFGIYVSDAGSNGNLILGNFIGTDVTGTQNLGNSSNGISVFGAAGNTIGGTAVGAGNVISGNGAYGISFGPSGSVGASDNLVQGNLIGTDITGTTRLGNSIDGILINSMQSTDNTIGGTMAGAGNIISGNNEYGVNISNASGNLVQGNFLGTNPTGANLGNLAGVVIANASNNTIGGTAAGSANVIAFNTGAAVTVDTGTGNPILQNSIFANGQGIVLVNGGNANQPAPTLTAADSFPGTTMVEGQLSGFAASTTYTIEFFASAPGDPTTPGQAHRFLGSQTLTTDGSGSATIATTLSVPVPVGQVITATATSVPDNNTSEFSAVTVDEDATTTALTSSPNPSVYGQSVTLTATVTAAAPGAGTPTGTVTFMDGSTALGTGTLNAAGVATLIISTLDVAGSPHSITAVYKGDTNDAGSTGTLTNGQTVNADSTSTVVSSSVNPSAFGQSVTFTATVSVTARGPGHPPARSRSRTAASRCPTEP